LILALVVVELVGCKSSQSTPAAASNSLWNTYTSQTLTMSYSGALNAASQLMLGTMRLEATENTVTPEQATTLLVLWQALQGRVLQSDAERNAVLEYIEKQMTPAQLEAIAAMHLTQADLLAGTRGNAQGAGTGPGQGGAGQRGASGTPPASGSAFPGGRGTPPAMGTRPAQLGRATPQASGTVRGTSSGAITGSAQDAILLTSLIRLLSQRAAEGAATPVSSRTPYRAPAPTPLPSPTPTIP
jgi:hypothetical protein